MAQTATQVLARRRRSAPTPQDQAIVGNGDVINPALAPYNVLPGVTPNPELGLQAALDAAGVNAVNGRGPTAVLLQGTYLPVDVHTVTGQVSVASGLHVPSGVWLAGRGAKVSLKANAQLPAGATQGHIISGGTSPYAGALLTTSKNVTISGIEVDGNALNQAGISGVAVAAATTLGAGNSGLLFTAVRAGGSGGSLSVQLKNPLANSQALSVVAANPQVVGGAPRQITVNLATDAGGVVTSTAEQVRAAVAASGAAAAVVTPTNVGDGSGVVIPTVRTWLSGGTGTTEAIYFGIFLGSTENGLIERCVVKNVFGNDTSPPGETMHYEVNHCHGVVVRDCVADGTGILDTASGFSSDASQNVVWSNCTGRNMGTSHGFTHYKCSDMTYVGCSAYNNQAGAGFNSEISDGVTFTACKAGGVALTYSSATDNQFYPTDGAPLGNKYGYLIQGSRGVTIDGSCQARLNQWNLRVRDANYGASHPDNGPCDRVSVSGAVLDGSIGAGGDGSQDVLVDATTTNWAVRDVLIGDARYGSTIPFPARITMGSQVAAFYYSSNGVREYVKGHTQTAAGSVFRRLYEVGGTGTVAETINGLGQTVINAAHARKLTAVAAAYTIKVTDSILSVDTTAARALTLPAANAVAAGTTFTIKDATGNAAAANITVGKAGADTIEGAVSTVVNTNWGKVTLVSDGTSKWLLV